MEKLFGSGINKKVTGKAADSGYNATQTTVPKLQNLFQSNTSGTSRQVTGKAADANLQTGVQSATAASAAALSASNSGYTATKNTSSLPRVQMPSLQTTSQNLGAIGTTKQVTGKAADSGYTVGKKQASQAANRQTVQNWWKQPKRRLWRMKRGCFEEAARLADMKCPGIVTPRRWADHKQEDLRKGGR